MTNPNAPFAGVLEPDEHLLWSTSPDPGRMALSALAIYIFAIPWTIFTAGWLWLVTDGLQWLPPAVGIYPSWTPRFYAWTAILAFLPGAWMLTAPLWAWRKARQTRYGITNRRVLLMDVRHPNRTQSLKLEGRLSVRVKNGDARSGDFEFAREQDKKGLFWRAVPHPEKTLRELQENGFSPACPP